jgi:cytochrome c1
MRRFGTAAILWMALGCGGEKAPPAPAAATGGSEADGLTPFEMENGIGPIKEVVVVGPLDHAMAEAGEKVFEQKCSACHKMGEKYVGPALGQVTVRRTPTYIMNMVLNPQEMVERHPVAKKLLAEHMTFMPNQGLTRDEARQVVEYLRSEAAEKKD